MRLTRVFSAIVLGVILLQSSVMLIFWQSQVEQLHFKNWDTNVSEDIVKLSLTYDEYEKCRVNSHEIRIHNEMYDIKRCTRTALGVELIAVCDTEEKRLSDNISNLFSSTNAMADGSKRIQLSILFTLNYIHPLYEFTFEEASFFTRLHFQNLLSETTHYGDITTPPPKLKLTT